MATSAISGKDMTMTNVGGATEITNIRVDEVLDIYDATSNGSSGHREYISGLQGVTGSATCIGTKPSKGSATGLAIDSQANT